MAAVIAGVLVLAGCSTSSGGSPGAKAANADAAGSVPVVAAKYPPRTAAQAEALGREGVPDAVTVLDSHSMQGGDAQSCGGDAVHVSVPSTSRRAQVADLFAWWSQNVEGECQSVIWAYKPGQDPSTEGGFTVAMIETDRSAGTVTVYTSDTAAGYTIPLS